MDIPAAFIDDNIHTGNASDLTDLAPGYQMHLQNAGMPDKPAKRELLIHRGEILGRWFDSVQMTLSIPQDKINRLTGMLTDFLTKPLADYSSLSELLGYWEFCASLLPKFMAAFVFTAYLFKTAFHLYTW